MGNWSYNPTYRSYNPIYNWKGAHLVRKVSFCWVGKRCETAKSQVIIDILWGLFVKTLWFLQSGFNDLFICMKDIILYNLDGGFKDLLCSSLFGKMIQLDLRICFSDGLVKNHQLVIFTDPINDDSPHEKKINEWFLEVTVTSIKPWSNQLNWWYILFTVHIDSNSYTLQGGLRPVIGGGHNSIRRPHVTPFMTIEKRGPPEIDIPRNPVIPAEKVNHSLKDLKSFFGGDPNKKASFVR